MLVNGDFRKINSRKNKQYQYNLKQKAMKKTVITQLALAFLLLLSTFNHAQNIAKISPDGIFEHIFDDYGNDYNLKDIVIEPVKTALVPCSSTSYFNLYFENGSGFEDLGNPVHTARRNVICQVFSDISAFIVPANSNQKVNIWVKDINSMVSNASSSGVLGMASAFHALPYGAPAYGGITDGEIWKTINLGQNSFSGLANPLITEANSDGGFYHGMVVINFSNSFYAWHTALGSATAPGTVDLYTVLLHEITHALGFSSLINSNGQSKFASSGCNYYSRYDTFLKNAGGQNLITNSGSCSMYNYTFNPGLNANSTLAPSPGSCLSNTTICGTAIKFAGSVNQAVYTPNCWEAGSSLSHLEELCRNPQQANDEYYVMSNAGGAGATYMKRAYRLEERKVLCDLGYKVNTSFGNSANLNYATYTGGICAGLQVAGRNDGITSSGAFAWYTTPGNAITFTGASLLGNDFNATGFECLENIFNNGTVNVTSGNGATSITFNATAQGIALLRYVPKNSLGQKGNITYVFISVGSANCIPSACNMISNGGFESSTGCGQFVVSPHPVLDCWGHLAGSEVLFSRTPCSQQTPNSPSWLIPTNSNLFSPSTETWDGPGNGNNQFLMMRGGDAMQTTLSSPIMPNVPYTLSFWAKKPNSYGWGTYSISSIEFRGDPSFSTTGPFWPIIPPFTMGQGLITTTLATSNNWSYITLNFTYTGAQPLNSLYVANLMVNNSHILLIDDLVLQPTSVAGSFNPPDICLPATIPNLQQYADPPGGVFTGNNVTNNGGVYAFSTNQQGVYPVVYTYTNANGCAFNVFADIALIRPNTPTITVTPPYSTLCIGSQLTFTASGAVNYTWNPAGSCVSPCSVVVVSPIANTVYTVSGNDGLGCSTGTTTVEVSVTSPASCCGAPNQTLYYYSALDHGVSTISNQVLEILGTYHINTSMTYNNVTFRMVGPDAQLSVSGGKSLVLNNCRLYSCGEMWDGIYMLKTGSLVSTLTVNNSSIEDSKNGIVSNSANTAAGPPITLINTLLNKNQYGIQISNYTGTADYPLSIRQSTISCLTSAISPGATLKSPLTGQRGSIGIMLLNVKKIKVGNSSVAAYTNKFINLDYGIHVLGGSLQSVNNSFTMDGLFPYCLQLPQPPQPPCPPLGIAIFAPNTTPSSATIIVGGTAANEANRFENVLYAVKADYIHTASIVKNVFTCTANSTSFPQGFGYSLTGNSGVSLSDVSNVVGVQQNNMANFATMIDYNRNTGSYNYNPVVTIKANTIGASGSGYISAGINVSDLSTNTISGASTVLIQDNILSNITATGIRLMYIKNRPVVSGSSVNSQQVGMLYNASAQKFGMYIFRCERAVVTNNYVSSASGNLNMHGIYLYTSFNSLVRCNTLQSIGCGITIHGDCTGPYTSASSFSYGIISNTFNSNMVGLNLRNSGKVGQQGDATHPTGNRWSGTFSNGQTRTDASSPAANSIFYCINSSTPPTTWPTAHTTIGSGTAYSNTGTTATIKASSGSNPTCPGPSMLEEPETQPDAPAEMSGRLARATGVESIEEETLPVIGIYPNPNNGVFNLQSNTQLNNVTVRVVDVLGKVVLSTTYKTLDTESIDISPADKGVYTIEITDDRNTQYFKLIKE